MSPWDNFNNWRTTMHNLRAEYENLTHETRQLVNRKDAQSKQHEAIGQEVFQKRDVLMDTAYAALDAFVDDLLKYTDGDAEIGSDGVPTLPKVVDCFKALAKFCEGVIDGEGREAVEATQEIGEDGQIVQRLKNLQTRLQSDLNGLSQAVSDAKGIFDVNHEHHMNARDALSRAEDRKRDFLYSIFGDNDTDRSYNSCRENEDMWHKRADEDWAIWDQFRNLNNEFQPLHNNQLGQLLSDLSTLADQIRANYNKIGEDRKIDEQCWLAARTLQYHVTTNTEYTSRNDALRHVIKLIHTANKTIDSDSDVISLKQHMENNIREKLGQAKADELHKEKSYLANPDADF